jgi:hypothetical protein
MTTDKVISIIEARKASTANLTRDYNQAIDDIINDIGKAIQRELDGEMTELGDRNYALISQAVKTFGSYDPNEIFCMFEERLYTHEGKTIKKFLQWVHDGKRVEKHGHLMTERGFGSGNYEQRFQEFLAFKNKV